MERRNLLRGVGGALIGRIVGTHAGPILRGPMVLSAARGAPVAGSALIAGTIYGAVLAVPAPAKAELLTAGILIATALYEVFRKFGLPQSELVSVRDAPDIAGRNDGSFHDQFNDPNAVGVSRGWRFANGQVVGVRGNAFAGRDATNAKGAEYNRAELMALQHARTLSDYGSLMPISARQGLNRSLVAGYKELVAKVNRQPAYTVATPQYARTFTNFAEPGSDSYVGVFGPPVDGTANVVWISESDARLMT